MRKTTTPRSSFGSSNLSNLLDVQFSRRKFVGPSLCRNPPQVVMGGDSCSEGCGFESQHCLLDGHFSHLFVIKLFVIGICLKSHHYRRWHTIGYE